MPGPRHHERQVPGGHPLLHRHQRQGLADPLDQGVPALLLVLPGEDVEVPDVRPERHRGGRVREARGGDEVVAERQEDREAHKDEMQEEGGERARGRERQHAQLSDVLVRDEDILEGEEGADEEGGGGEEEVGA